MMLEFVEKLPLMPDFCAIGKVDQVRIEEAERALGLSFAEEYRAYLAAFGVAAACGHELTGLCDSLRLNVVSVTEVARADVARVPADWYVVEQTGMDGALCWQSGQGKIYQTMPGREPILLCDSLLAYVTL